MQIRQQQTAVAQKQNDPVLKLFRFTDRLGSFKADQQPNAIEIWRTFVDEFFTEDGTLQLVYLSSQTSQSKAFEVSAASMPRYFWTQFDGVVDQIQISLNGTFDNRVSDTHHAVRAERARMTYWFKDGTQVSDCLACFEYPLMGKSDSLGWSSHGPVPRHQNGSVED